MTERNAAEGTLTFQVFTGQDFALANNAVLIAGKRDADSSTPASFLAMRHVSWR